MTVDMSFLVLRRGLFGVAVVSDFSTGLGETVARLCVLFH
jgi:hypothetical protein